MIANTDENQSGGSDVIFGGLGLPVTILLNDTGQFVSQRFAGPGGDALRALDTGDIDGDGAQDVLIGNYGPPSGVSYANGRGGYTATQPFGGPGLTTAVALGDLDGDGDLDAVLADPIQSRVYLNQGGRFAPGITGCDDPAAVRCFGGGFVPITALALGDVNGDGSLDIAAAITNSQSLVYLNDGQGNFAATSPIGPPVGQAQAVAYGDVDRDGDLDLAIGANDGFNAVYLNDGGGGFPNGAVDCASIGVRCFGVASTALSDIDVGDVNGDGALDIAVANNARQSLAYLNDGRGGFVFGEVPCSDSQVRCFGIGERTLDVELGDLDADGDLDVTTANFGEYSNVYINAGGVFLYTRGLEFSRNFMVTSALADMDADGTIDIVTGSDTRQNVIYRDLRFRGARLPNQPVTVAVERPGAVAAPADGASPEVLGAPLIPVRYRLFDPEGGTVAQVRAFFSLDGGGSWTPAVPAAGTPTTNLAASPEGTAHTFTWDTFASGVFGQSDRVVLRFVAANGPAAAAYGPPGTVRYTRQAAGPTQYPAGVGTTPPFRVRGTQVQVRQENGAPAASALVYRIPAGERRGGATLSAGSGEAFRTSPLGTLPGRGQLGLGDRLVALYPITATDTYTIYLTSAAPTADGLQSQTVAAPGVQTLTVSPDNPLVLLNLDVALEWDAREDRAFVEQLRFDLQRAAELLYDWSDGQVTLGAIRIFHDRERWDDAHIRIYATNRLRPNANQGGIIAEPLADPDRPAVIYEPGQVRMGAVWNRYGEASGNLGEDWPRTLAHELGHFALFLDDNYLGLDPAGRLIAVAGCRGAMSDPYRADYGEFHPPGAAWDAACSTTLSERSTGRADWETIRRFYDRPELGVALNQPAAFGANPGPNILPLAVTQITEMPLGRESAVVDVPIFSLTEGGARTLPGPTARAFLFPQEGDRIVDLGQPVLDQVTARGARPGDRLCVYEAGAARLGCEVVSEGDDTLDLQVLAGEAWSPDIRVTPVTSRTIDLRVANVPAGLTLRARLYATAAAPGQSPPTITLTEATGVYTGRFTLDDPTLDGVIQVWAEGGALRESITDFALGGNPGFRRARNAPRGSPGFRRARNAPAVSTDGQVILFSDNLQFDEGEFFTVQPATRLPAPPPGRTLVGQGYWLSASAGAPDLAGVSINLGYLSRDVLPGAEEGIGLYHWDGARWRALNTARDAVRNEASAVITGPGLYALMTSIPLPLTGPGWNLIASPARGTLPIREALASIEGFYTLVYGYAPDDRTDPWRVYAPDAPAWVSDLESLEFGKGYWINASESITLYLPVGDARAQARDTRQPAAASLPAPPATYYGAAPGVGLTVEASVNGQLCGQSQTVERELRGQLRPTFVVNVRAADTGANAGCGTPGAVVTISFRDGARTIATYQTRWDNSAAHELIISRVFLPLTGT